MTYLVTQQNYLWIIIWLKATRSVSISQFSLIFHIYIWCTLYGAVECMLLLFRWRVMPQLRLFQARPIHTGPISTGPALLWLSLTVCVYTRIYYTMSLHTGSHSKSVHKPVQCTTFSTQCVYIQVRLLHIPSFWDFISKWKVASRTIRHSDIPA